MRPLAGLVGVLTLLALELVRLSGPLIDTSYGQGGAQAAAVVALLTYTAPAAAMVLLAGRPAASPSRSVLVVGSVLLVVLRLLVQAVAGAARFWLGLATVAVALAVLTVAVAVLAARPGGGRAAAAAMFLGAAAGVGLQLALGTWDAVWRHTVVGWSIGLLLAASVVVLTVLAGRDPTEAAPIQPGRVWAVGPLLALMAMMLANPAFAAAQAGVGLVVTGPVLGAGLLAGAVIAQRRVRNRAVMHTLLVAGVATALAFGGRTGVDPVIVLVGLLAAQLAGAGVLGDALERPHRPRAGGTRLVLVATAAGVGVLTIVPILLHQLEYSVPLPFPHDLVLVVTAALLGLSAWGGPIPALAAPGAGRRPVVVTSAVLLLGSAVAVVDAVPRTPLATYAPRPAVVLSWNLHYGVSPAGAVDLEQVARTIEFEDPDVVLLQEVSRGWVQGGGVDMATWLSRRLDRQYAFAPAADRRFGNVVLARARPRSVRVVPLPYGAGPQDRSALIADVDVAGQPMRVVSVHLQHRSVNTPTRIDQLQTLLAALPSGAGPVLVGGDLNATPGSAEVRLLESAGFVSAVDSAGDRAALTDPSTAPTRRIDWLLGRGVRFADARVLTGATSSDHLPVVAAVMP